MVYLKRAVKRRFGSDVQVRLVDVESAEARGNLWGQERPLPVVIIDGKVFSKGTLSFHRITQELSSLRSRG